MYIECSRKVAEKNSENPMNGTTHILNELLADEEWLTQVLTAQAPLIFWTVNFGLLFKYFLFVIFSSHCSCSKTFVTLGLKSIKCIGNINARRILPNMRKTPIVFCHSSHLLKTEHAIYQQMLKTSAFYRFTDKMNKNFMKQRLNYSKMQAFSFGDELLLWIYW